MARTKEDALASKNDTSPALGKVSADGVKKSTGRPRGRPSSGNPPKVYVPTGRPRGRPKGTTKTATPKKVAKTTAAGETPRGRGRPRRSEAGATPAAKVASTPASGKSGRGRPKKSAVVPVADAENGEDDVDEDEDALADADADQAEAEVTGDIQVEDAEELDTELSGKEA